MSSDSTKPPTWATDDKFVAVKEDLASEISGLSRRFDQFTTHIDTRFDLLIERLFPMIERIESRQDDFNVRLNRHEKDLADVRARIGKLEQSAERRLRKGKK